MIRFCSLGRSHYTGNGATVTTPPHRVVITAAQDSPELDSGFRSQGLQALLESVTALGLGV